MAKIIIEIEDLGSDKVKVVSNPTMEQMINMDLNNHKMTSAHGYAYAALNHIRKLSKSNDPTNIIDIPKLIR